MVLVDSCFISGIFTLGVRWGAVHFLSSTLSRGTALEIWQNVLWVPRFEPRMTEREAQILPLFCAGVLKYHQMSDTAQYNRPKATQNK